MTPRRVILTLEVETDAPLPVLRDRRAYVLVPGGTDGDYAARVIQAQANVVKDSRTGG